MEKTYRFEILRYDAAQGGQPRLEAFDFAPARAMSVLEALLEIQAWQDPSLAFRYACRGAVCGSCAMSINGRLQLACRVQLESLPDGRAVLEPLPHLEILRDLVVDMTPFWEKYERVRPWLHARLGDCGDAGMSPAEAKKLDNYVNCILCGLCYAACPVLSGNPDFTGPAALAKLYRFVSDSREEPGDRPLENEDRHEGVWACRSVTRCIQVCPKNVRPTDAVAGLRRRLVSQRFHRLLGRTTHEA
ncbi:MAG: succinate dehydrogenase iron-sulfur subunit [Pirellulales bacterium]|nr:succinate dehydrogenase iron-sulfur subunit [Pirellulales bacterium]